MEEIITGEVISNGTFTTTDPQCDVDIRMGDGAAARAPVTVGDALRGQHLRKLLSLGDSEPLFLYCQCAFAPPPDELLSDVAECFADNKGVLLVNYATIPAWG